MNCLECNNDELRMTFYTDLKGKKWYEYHCLECGLCWYKEVKRVEA